MAHHSNVPDEQLKQLLGLGATGEYPHGRLGPHDEGEIKIAIAADPDSQVVRVEFGKPIASIAFTVEEAESIADLLHAKVLALRGIT